MNGTADSKKLNMAKTKTFGKPDWFDIVEAEYEACRENVSLLDYSSFTKLDIQVSKQNHLNVLYFLSCCVCLMLRNLNKYYIYLNLLHLDQQFDCRGLV